MATATFDSFFKALRKGEVPAALYLHGPEEVLKEEALRELLERNVDAGLRDLKVDQRSAGTITPWEVDYLCNTVPMMADRRVVIIRDVEAWNRRAKAKAEVLRYLERPVPTTVLVLIQGGSDDAADPELAKKALAVAAEPLPHDRAKKWLLH